MKAPEQNIAVVGGGYWGKNLVRNFYQLGALNTVCDTDLLKQEQYNRDYPGVAVTDNFEEVLADQGIDGVVIATPAVEHYSMTKAALKAGKDVLVEKPLALNIEEGQELNKLAREKKRVLMVGHVLEYHPAVVKLAGLVKNGELGKVQYIYSNRLNLGKFRTEENILWSFAPHDISVIINLLGRVPYAVTSSGESYLSKGIADVTISNLFFNNGIKAHIFVSWLHPYKEQKLVVVGSEKMAVFDDVSSEKLYLYNHKVNWVDHCPVAAKGEAEKVEVETGEPLKQECMHFLECMAGRSTPRTGPKNALDVLKVLNASQKSLEENGAKVYLEQLEAGKEALPASAASSNQVFESQVNDVYIHPSSLVDSGVQVGPKTKIWHNCHIMSGASLGEGCTLGQNIFVGKNVRIGNNVKIQNNVSVFEGVTLEDDVFCGPSMVFTNVIMPRSAYPNHSEQYVKTVVKKGASIGANATIKGGITVGEHVLVGAGAVVTKDTPAHALIYGNPAKVEGWVCRCGKIVLEPGSEPLLCEECGTDIKLK